MKLKVLGMLTALTAAGATCAEARRYQGSDRPSWKRESAVGGVQRFAATAPRP